MRRRDFGLLICAATMTPRAALAQATNRSREPNENVRFELNQFRCINAVALKKATDTIPIVVGALADPIELGFIESYRAPVET